jgi:hypothetical protein
MCDPPNVGAQSATLEVQFVTEQILPAGSYLKVTVPEGTYLKQGTLPCAVTGVQNQADLRCEAADNVLWFKMESDLSAYTQNVYAFKNVFFPP